MRDMPFFTTLSGVASLTLSQIPYTGKAYIRIQDSTEPEQFLRECVSFCKAAGAQKIYATGHVVCDCFPEHTKLLRMKAEKSTIGETDAALFPVTEATLALWTDIYNQKISNVPNGAWMTNRDAQQMLRDGDGYLIHKDKTLLGIGKASGSEISWVASVVPGAGRDVVRALCHALSDESVSLVVASENRKAMQLYKRLGFVCTGVISTWFVV